MIGALQGFGQLWQKTYTIRLAGAPGHPRGGGGPWEERVPLLPPSESRFYPSLDGVEPGEIMLINATVQGMPVNTGVMVLYSDDVSFTVMTAEGLPEAGWNTFSAYEEDGRDGVAQIQSLARASDPIYEVGFRLFGSTAQEKIWTPRPVRGWPGVSGCGETWTWRRPAWTRSCSGTGSETSGTTLA